MIVPIVHRNPGQSNFATIQIRRLATMKAVFILFSSIWVSAWCVPAAPFNEVVPTLNNHLDTTAALHRIVRELNPLSIIQQITENIIPLSLETLLEPVLELIHSIYNSIKSIIRTVLDTIESIVNILFGQNNETTEPSVNNGNSTERRSRRSSPLSSLVLGPISIVRNVLQQIASITSNQIRSVVDSIVQALWDFFSAEVLPRVRRILETLDDTNLFPSLLIQSLIKSLDSLYFMMQMIGYAN